MCEPGRESPVVAETSSAMPIGSADRWPMTTNAVARGAAGSEWIYPISTRR
jgi:hypothetical protein